MRFKEKNGDLKLKTGKGWRNEIAQQLSSPYCLEDPSCDSKPSVTPGPGSETLSRPLLAPECIRHTFIEPYIYINVKKCKGCKTSIVYI